MTTPAAARRSPTPDFRIGRVFERAAAVYARNFPAFALIALLASAPALAAFVTGNHPADPKASGGVWAFLAVFGLSYLFFCSAKVLWSTARFRRCAVPPSI